MMLLSHTDIKTLKFFEKLTETFFVYILPKMETTYLFSHIDMKHCKQL